MIHRSSLWLLILLVVNGVWLGSAQVPFPGKCPDVKVVDPFDVEEYLGVWYEYAKYPFSFEIGRKCISATYGLLDESTVSVLNAGISQLTGQPSNITGTAKLLGPGQLAVEFFPGQPQTEPNYLVLGTDYESYAVVYSCTSVTPFANLKLVWILTRERVPSTETIDKAEKILVDNNISQAPLVQTAQKNCSEQ
ncbi:apolipoprotein D-like [Drosophila elegans]|uniref:apolipoprotein D-like n=1 Tax=Drosophila elegans TaxID=30023 RepID=UPI0007E5C4F8|nr:apolipoprotein D-like [Drosophila elegans]